VKEIHFDEMKMNNFLRKVFKVITVLGLALFVWSSLSDEQPAGFGKPTEEASVVRVKKVGQQYQLIRNGKPYFVKGAGGDTHLDLLKESGGNSIRTWGVNQADSILQEANSRGLTVTLGIWLNHEMYFNYNNPASLEKQREKVPEDVRKFKDALALLVWGLGNGVELHSNPANPAMWKALNSLAGEIKKIDPNHPVMTVVAGVNKKKIDAIKKYYSNIDILGVNSYGPAQTLPQRLKKLGWKKPYMLTEFGSVGWWESPKTSWGAPIEASSTVKELRYLYEYQAAVASQKGWALGSYVFVWGHKWEGTLTWFNLFLQGSEDALSPVDAMALTWTGKKPANSAPEIISFQCDAGLKKVEAGSVFHAEVIARDIDQDLLHYSWRIYAEKLRKSDNKPQFYPDDILEKKDNELEFSSPKSSGAYRLYVFVSDGKGKAATANVPFYVK